MKIIKAITIASALWVMPAQAMTLEEYRSLTLGDPAKHRCIVDGGVDYLAAGVDMTPAYECFIRNLQNGVGIYTTDADLTGSGRDDYRVDLERAKRDLSRELERAEDKRREELDTLIMRMNRQNSTRGSEYYRENMRTKIYHK